MKITGRACVVVLATVPFWFPLDSQAQDTSAPRIADSARATYDHSPDLPNGIAFISTIDHLSQIEDASPEMGLRQVIKHMELEAEEAQALFDQMLAALARYERAASDMEAGIFCADGAPKANGSDAFRLVEIFEDATDGLAEQHAYEFKQGLDTRTAVKFQQWLNVRKTQTVHVKLNHVELAQNTPNASIDGYLTTACAAPQ